MDKAHAQPAIRTIPVLQGTFAVAGPEDDVVLSAILGSCVATCLWDPVRAVGGMNHILVPHGSGTISHSLNAMELLVNGILKRGGERSRLKAMVFGGAHIIKRLPDIGAANLAFVLRFLTTEGIGCVGQSVSSNNGLRVRFRPVTGKAATMIVPASDEELKGAERQSQHVPAPAGPAVEFF